MTDSNIQERTKKQRKAVIWTLTFGLLMFLAGMWLSYSCFAIQKCADCNIEQVAQKDSLDKQNDLLVEYSNQWKTVTALHRSLFQSKKGDRSKFETNIASKVDSIEKWVEENKNNLDLGINFMTDKAASKFTVEIINGFIECKEREVDDECCDNLDDLKEDVRRALRQIESYDEIEVNLPSVSNRNQRLIDDILDDKNGENETVIDNVKSMLNEGLQQ